MVVTVRSLGLTGIRGYEVSVECFLSGGLPAFDVVGLPDAAVKESRERVRAAVKNCGAKFPVSRITVNLAPARVRKEGTLYDLPILLGILAGYAVALAAGMVDLSGIGEASWFSLPQVLPFGVTFEPSGCIALGLLFAINSIQAIGDLTATTVGGMDREPTDRELQGGIAAYGVSNILTALLGGLPTATYSQNVGIVATNKVINRWVFAMTGGFLLLAGVVPKFSAVLTTIPQCVLGGATVAVFSTIAMTGMKLIAGEGITARNTTIVGLSAALGVGISQAAEALAQFPEAVTTIFGKSPVVIATLLAVFLNLVLPREDK